MMRLAVMFEIFANVVCVLLKFWMGIDAKCNVGPYAWVSHVPGEAVPPSQPNEGSVKLRNEKKRRRQRREFIKVWWFSGLLDLCFLHYIVEKVSKIRNL